MSITTNHSNDPISAPKHLLRQAIGVVVLLGAFSPALQAQQLGTCESGEAQAFLNVNNVRAAIYNAGNLFWRGSRVVYTVPQSSGVNAIFTAGIWIGGMVDGELRFAGTAYGPYDYFPGPLTESGALPNASDCTEYDRIYELTIRDLKRLDSTGEATANILDWPWQHGAPVTDGDGDPNNYDLSAGDRPELTGHQMFWWVMNDLGGQHKWSEAAPLGLEIRSSAFAVLGADAALQNTTFYRHILVNKQDYVIEDAYYGWFVDADLGYAVDDFVGSDTLAGMGFFYNGDNDDDVEYPGYGLNPPAVGIDFIRGPLAASNNIDNDMDGTADEDGERLQMSVFLYWNSDSTPQGNPFGVSDYYNYLRGIWRDGRPMTVGGTGYGGDQSTMFMFPGDPVQASFWSELNTDGRGSRNTPSDRRFLMSTGPFRLEPGESHEIVTAVVWARGDDHLDSVAELRTADAAVQEAWDSSRLRDVELDLPPIKAPILTSPDNGVSRQPVSLTLNWNVVPFAPQYRIELAKSPDFDGPSSRTLVSLQNSVEVDSLLPFTDYYWRVRAESPIFVTPMSETYRFRTSDSAPSGIGVQTIPGATIFAFLEIVGPGGTDPCDGRTVFGCQQAGGDLVYASFNSTEEYVMYHAGPGPEASLLEFAPYDFDIRFTEAGSFGAYALSSGKIIRVPFEIWDVGPVGLFNENDPADDVQLIPVLFADQGGDCTFGYDEGDDPSGLGWGMSDRIHAYYARSSYAEWEAAVEPLVEGAADHCFPGDDALFEMIDIDRGRPLQGLIFIGDPDFANAPGEGTVIRLYTTPDEPASPLLAAPAPGTGPFDQPLTLWWNAQRGPGVTYQLQISAGPTFDNPILDATVENESFVVSGLADGRTYLWRVRLSQPEGPWSDIWTFTAGEVTNASAEPTAELPTELTLDQNYPNPFNPSTTIRFGLPEAGHVHLIVYDLLGRRVASLVDDTFAAGWHDVTWDAPAHASGVYVYSLETGERRISKSLVVVK